MSRMESFPSQSPTFQWSVPLSCQGPVKMSDSLIQSNLLYCMAEDQRHKSDPENSIRIITPTCSHTFAQQGKSNRHPL